VLESKTQGRAARTQRQKEERTTCATAACPAELKEIAAATTAETAFPAMVDDSSAFSPETSSSFLPAAALTMTSFLFLLETILLDTGRLLPATNCALEEKPRLDDKLVVDAAMVFE